MDTKTIFDGTISVAEKALDLRSRRHELLLSNLANADTPNYKAFDLLVEEALANQVEPHARMNLTQTSPAHRPSSGPAADNARAQVVNLSTQVTLRGDGNTVDMEREMSSLASNQLQYKISTQIIYKKFQGLRNVIQGGGR